MSNKKLSEFNVVNTLDNNDLFLINHLGTTSTVKYDTVSETLSSSVYGSLISEISALTGAGTTTLFSQNSGLSSISLSLPAGTWVVQAWFCSFQTSNPITSLLIDNSVVMSLPNYGDPAGATFVPLMGMSQLSGSRTITCIASGWAAGTFNTNSARFSIRADLQKN